MRTGAIDFRKSSTNKQQLTLVTGESGSGKTASSIAAVVLDYLHHSRTLCLFHEMPPGFETSVVNAEKSGGNDEAKMQARNNKVRSHLLNLLSSLNITAHSGADTHAVLILDELGPCPTVVRALCSIYSNVLAELALVAKVTKFFMIAVGTGLVNTTTQIGSAPDTYNFVRMSQETGEEFLSKLQAKFPQQLQELVRVNSRYRIGLEAWRSLTNRRVAACFATHTVPAVHLGLDIDWRQSLSTALSMALARAKDLNGFSRKTRSECMSCFSRALAHSFGSRDQGKHLSDEDRQDLMVKTGILLDNAVGVKSEKDTVGESWIVPEKEKHRFSISVATVENGLRSFGMVQRDRSGEGFEDTIRDFVMVQILAGSSGVTISSPQADVLLPLKELLRETSKTVSLIVTVSLQQQVTTIDDAIAVCNKSVVTEAKRQQPLGGTTQLAVLIKNGPQAPGADLFVVIGELQYPSATAAEPCDSPILPQDKRLLELSLQMKHYTSTSLATHAAAAELYKMGDRQHAALAGQIAAHVPRAAFTTPPPVQETSSATAKASSPPRESGVVIRKIFNEWVTKHAREATSILQDADFKEIVFANNSVMREKVYTFLMEHLKNKSPASNPRQRFFLTALVPTAATPPTKDCLFGGEDDLKTALYPVLFNPEITESGVRLELTTSVAVK